LELEFGFSELELNCNWALGDSVELELEFRILNLVELELELELKVRNWPQPWFKCYISLAFIIHIHIEKICWEKLVHTWYIEELYYNKFEYIYFYEWHMHSSTISSPTMPTEP
jgi:hypothetical protein